MDRYKVYWQSPFARFVVRDEQEAVVVKGFDDEKKAQEYCKKLNEKERGK